MPTKIARKRLTALASALTLALALAVAPMVSPPKAAAAAEITTIDDATTGTGANQWNYTGTGWNHCTNCNEGQVTYANASQSWDTAAGDTATLAFTGTQIQLYAVVAPWHGIGALSIDGGPEQMVDFYGAAKTGNVLLWTSPTLTNGPHTFKLRNTNTHNPNSRGTVITVDRADVQQLASTTGTTSGGSPSGFVSRVGNRLVLNGATYQFVGTNNYSLTGCDGTPVPASQAEAYFAQLKPNTMTRVWAFRPQGFAPIQQTVALAEKYNQKLILTFADGAGYCHEPAYTLDWYRGGYKTDGVYFPWIQQLTTAFKNSPAVAFWEIMNEPGSLVNPSLGSWPGYLTTDDMKSFFDTTAAYIKQNDPNHLVSTGTNIQGFDRTMATMAQVHSGPNIDIVSDHEYDYGPSNGTQLGSTWVDMTYQAAQSINKPAFVGEFGVGLQNGSMTADQRASAVKQKFDVYLREGLSGAVYWCNIGYNYNGGTVTNRVYNNDPMLNGSVINMIAGYGPSPTTVLAVR